MLHNLNTEGTSNYMCDYESWFLLTLKWNNINTVSKI